MKIDQLIMYRKYNRCNKDKKLIQKINQTANVEYYLIGLG